MIRFNIITPIQLLVVLALLAVVYFTLGLPGFVVFVVAMALVFG